MDALPKSVYVPSASQLFYCEPATALRSKPRYARTAFSIYDKLENLFDATHRCVAPLLPVLDWDPMDDEALGRPVGANQFTPAREMLCRTQGTSRPPSRGP